MKYFLSKDFSDYVHNAFHLEKGSVMVVKSESVTPDDQICIFWYSKPYVREGKKQEKFKGKEGWYLWYNTDYAASAEELLQTTKLWYGSDSIEVVGYEKTSENIFTSTLIRIEPPSGYWKESRGSNE